MVARARYAKRISHMYIARASATARCWLLHPALSACLFLRQPSPRRGRPKSLWSLLAASILRTVPGPDLYTTTRRLDLCSCPPRRAVPPRVPVSQSRVHSHPHLAQFPLMSQSRQSRSIASHQFQSRDGHGVKQTRATSPSPSRTAPFIGCVTARKTKRNGKHHAPPQRPAG